MSRKVTAVLSSLLLFATVLPTALAGEAYDDWSINCMIRKDKFRYVLPQAMRSNDIDMWIVIDKGRGTEPLFRDFGIATSNGNGLFIFTDRGESIEKAQMGGHQDLAKRCGAYDIIGGRRDDLRSFVAERDPERIGVNFTTDQELFPLEGRHLSNGLSYTDYNNLKATLGEPYASRLVSAERLIADFRARRVASEIIEFSKIADMTRKLEERALSNEVITPNKTTQADIVWWLEEQRKAMGLERGWRPSVYLSPPDGVEIGNSDRVVQRGDVMQIDYGIGRNNFFTDIKRFAYVLREGETEAPAWVKRAFEESVKVRNIIQENVVSGKTGREQIDNLKRLVKAAGYVYTEEERASDVEGIEVNIGMHAAGNLGHDVGAGLFEIFPTRTTYEVRPNSIISVEFIVFTPADEWGGKKVPVNIEENALITDHGIEWLVPTQNEVLVIR